MRIPIVYSILVIGLTSSIVTSLSSAQGYAEDEYADYQDYAGEYGQEDNLYYDYAQRQQSKK
jgi:hypothetical protein